MSKVQTLAYVFTFKGGSITQWLAYLLLDPSTPGLILSAPEFFSEEKTVDVAEIYQRHYFDESGQWLENVDQTHLVLARGELVLQKSFPFQF